MAKNFEILRNIRKAKDELKNKLVKETELPIEIPKALLVAIDTAEEESKRRQDAQEEIEADNWMYSDEI